VGHGEHCGPDAPAGDAPHGPRPVDPPSRRSFLGIVGALTTALFVASALAYLTMGPRPDVPLGPGATVYFNEACGDCQTYLDGELLPALKRAGHEPVVKDYISDRAFRAELTAVNDALGVPFDLQSHLATFVRDRGIIAFEGHVPAALVDEALALDPASRPAALLVYQDRMDVAASYRAWAFSGASQAYPISTSLRVYIEWYEANVGSSDPVSPTLLLPLVLSTGLLDGLNPCAFAVLLFFVSFLYAVRAQRPEVLRMGSVYAYAVFLVYFLIGLGLLGAIVVSEDPHLIARLAAGGVIGLGAFSLLRVAFPRLPGLNGLASSAWPRVRARIVRGSLPAATGAGFLVGLCTFPCSGGVYVAILGLLAAQTTFLEGLGYLYLYNGMYILPLLAVLGLISSRPAALAAARWERAHAAQLRVGLAAGMVLLGLGLLALSL